MTKELDKITKKVMKKINKHEVRMRPRAYFVAGSVLVGVGVTGLLLLTVFLTGVVFFRMRTQGMMTHEMMGRVGWWRVLPWKLILTAVAAFSGGLWLLRKNDKSYRISLSWMMLGAVMAVIGLGFLMDRMGVNNHLQTMHRLKPIYKIQSDDGSGGRGIRQGRRFYRKNEGMK